MMKKVLSLFLVLFLLLTITSCGKEEKKVVIASKPMTEQFILVEMLTALIEADSDIVVEQKMGIGGGTANIHPGIINGEIDIYPEYSGTGWLFVLKQDLINNPDELFAEVKEKYNSEYNIKWMEPYGFNNTFALAMDKNLAEEMNIKTYSDLSSKSNELIFGAEYDFYEREDGLPGLKEVYGFNFKNEVEMDIGLKYDAIKSKKVDVINAFSTDGLLLEYNLKVLEDDKFFFPSYQGATLVRNETLEKYPELAEILQKLEGAVSDEEMIFLNYQVDKENKDPKEVALNFLKEKGLI
jgi:glycine betaine/choline ABC-type transport system substrate-binding protein